MSKPITTFDVAAHANTLAAMASALLTGLASGKYDPEVAMTEQVLNDLGVIFPPALQVERALEIFLFLNKMTAPRAPIIPDGHGGFVPADNSTYNPKTGRFTTGPFSE